MDEIRLLIMGMRRYSVLPPSVGLHFSETSETSERLNSSFFPPATNALPLYQSGLLQRTSPLFVWYIKTPTNGWILTEYRTDCFDAAGCDLYVFYRVNPGSDGTCDFNRYFWCAAFVPNKGGINPAGHTFDEARDYRV